MPGLWDMGTWRQDQPRHLRIECEFSWNGQGTFSFLFLPRLVSGVWFTFVIDKNLVYMWTHQTVL